MNIILFYATETAKAFELIEQFKAANQRHGHEIVCIEAQEYLGLEHPLDLADPDTIYGFAVSGLSEQAKHNMVLLAKMLKNEYISKPAFIYSGSKKGFNKIKRQLQKILMDKNFDVVMSKVEDYDAIELDQSIDRLHQVFRQYNRHRKAAKAACDICEVCTYETD